MTAKRTYAMKSIFCDWFKDSSRPSSPEWEQFLMWEDDSCIYHILEMLEDEIKTLGPTHGDKISTLCASIISDLIKIPLDHSDPGLSHKLDFLRFCVCTEAMLYCSSTGRRPLIYWWIICSLSNREFRSPISEVDVYTDRLVEFFKSDCKSIRLSAPCRILYWGWMLFLYVRNSGALIDLAKSLSSWFFEFACYNLLHENDELFRELAITVLCQLSDWAVIHKPKFAKITVDILIRLNELSVVPTLAKIRISKILSGRVGASLRLNTVFWARSALERFNDKLTNQERISFLAASCESSTDFDGILHDIDNTISKYTTEVLSLNNDLISFYYNQIRLIGTLNPVVIHYAKRGSPEVALALLARWFGVSQEHQRVSPVLLDFSSYDKGPLYSVEGKCLKYESSSVTTLSRVTGLMNKLLKRNVLVSDDPAFSQNMDFSSLTRQEAIYKTEDEIVAFRAIDQLKGDQKYLAGVTGIADFSYQQHPVQALLMKQLGSTWPIVSSYEEPESDRVLRRAYLLASGEYSSGKKIGIDELTAVATYLEDMNVETELHIQQDIGHAEFIKAYTSNEFDLLWVSAHGKYDLDHPHNSAIVLSKEEITVAELLKIQKCRVGDRRLLVLNLCSGGNALIAECPCKMGLAPLLASAKQAVISHLWPVREDVATVFGALLAIGLVEYESYFDAYMYALDNLRKNQNDLSILFRSKKIKQPSLFRCLKQWSRPLSTKGLAHWGSPIFFE